MAPRSASIPDCRPAHGSSDRDAHCDARIPGLRVHAPAHAGSGSRMVTIYALVWCLVERVGFEPEIRFSVLPSTQSETPVPPKIHFETNPLRLREKHTLMSLPYRLFATPVQPKISSTRYVEPSRRSFSPMLWITSLKVVTR